MNKNIVKESNTEFVELKMVIEIERSAIDEIKKLEHHIEYLVDLDNWNDIKSISNVRVSSANINLIADIENLAKKLDNFQFDNDTYNYKDEVDGETFDEMHINNIEDIKDQIFKNPQQYLKDMKKFLECNLDDWNEDIINLFKNYIKQMETIKNIITNNESEFKTSRKKNAERY